MTDSIKHYGLIGKSLTHSFSQKYFTRKFKEEAIAADYASCEIQKIEDCQALFTNNFNGFNVTIPYKETIIPYLTKLDDTAREVGAVNTIKVTKDGNKKVLIGYNTDVIGFEQSLIPLLKSHHKNALILGTGGASKAVAYVLTRLNISFEYVSREAGVHKLSYHELSQQLITDSSLIINTTPLGMFPDTSSYPNIPYSALTENHLLFDLVYNPEETEFLKKGKALGSNIKNGLEMLELQAEAAYKIWID